MNCRLPPLWCLLAGLLLLTLAGPSSARGGRGGSRGGSSRSSRGSSSSRSRSYGSSRGRGYSTLPLLVSKRFSYRTNMLAYRRGIFFVPLAWRQSHPDYAKDTTLCFNIHDNLPDQYNDSVLEPWLYQNRTVYGLFVCPMEEGRKDRVYCCGSKERQTCCSFWEDTGKVAGLFIGLALSICACVFAAFRIHRACLLRSRSASQAQVTIAGTTPMAAAIAAPQACGHPTDQQLQPQPESADDSSKQPQMPLPPGYYDQSSAMQPPPPPVEASPYPTFAPPSYWDVSNSQSNEQSTMPPVRY